MNRVFKLNGAVQAAATATCATKNCAGEKPGRDRRPEQSGSLRGIALFTSSSVARRGEKSKDREATSPDEARPTSASSGSLR
jgi:hypothetical protein